MADVWAMPLLIHHLRQCPELEGASEARWVGRIRAYFLCLKTPVNRELAAFILGGIEKQGDVLQVINPIDGEVHYLWRSIRLTPSPRGSRASAFATS